MAGSRRVAQPSPLHLGNGQPGSFRRETGARPQPLAVGGPAAAACKGLLLAPRGGIDLTSPLQPVAQHDSGNIGVAGYSHGPPRPLQSAPALARSRRLQGAFTRPTEGYDLTREQMLLRLAGQAEKKKKRIAELRARLTETLSPVDRDRTCRELTRMQGERIKTSLGTAHVRREIPPPTRG